MIVPQAGLWTAIELDACHSVAASPPTSMAKGGVPMPTGAPGETADAVDPDLAQLAGRSTQNGRSETAAPRVGKCGVASRASPSPP